MQSRLIHVSECFKNGDRTLGIRRLIDAVSETGDPGFFRQVIQLIEESENSESKEIPEEKTNALMYALERFPFPSVQVPGGENPLMKVNEISKQYAHGNFKMSPVSFELKYGEVVGLVGENGNGKTTLLRLLCKDLEPDNGSVSYAAESKSKNNYELRSRLIYIPQRVPRWFGSLMDNLHFTLSMHGMHGEDNILKAELILARLGLRPYRHLGWNRISSGYRTRFELAKSLLRKPELMLLDEPLSNLDIISQQTILQDLKYMSESVSHPFGLVLSSQQLYEVEKISDLVIFLKQGNPQYQHKQHAMSPNETELIFELEADETRDTLVEVFKNTGISKIHFNGGVYLLHFKSGTKQNEIYRQIGAAELKVNYIRNITHSSRRFFIQ